MGQLDKSLLLQKEKLEIVKVDLNDTDFVYVRQMTGHERDLFEQSLRKETKDDKGVTTGYAMALEDFRAKLAVITICDEKGDLLLSPKDYFTLSSNMSAAKLEKIINVAQKINAITEEDKNALVKNSKADLDGNSNSDSAEK